MSPTPSFSPAPAPDSRVAYAQASLAERIQALAFAQQQLPAHFPTLSLASWTTALERLQPDLWREGTQVYLDAAALPPLVQLLAASSELPPLDPPIYPSQAAYLAKRLVNYQDQAIDALAELEAAPHAYGGRVFNLVLELADGNGIAQQVFGATHRGAQQRPGSPDPAEARAAARTRMLELRRVRGEVAFAVH